jgi:ribose transport system substrate-binding protein
MKIRVGIALLALAAIGCNGGSGGSAATTGGSSGEANNSGDKPLVAFSQANSSDPWRLVFDAEIKAAADAKSGEMSFEEQAADEDPKKQIDVIDTFLLKNPKVLLVSPCQKSVQQATDKAFDKGIPVIMLDRSVEGDKFTAYVGGDNVEIGRQAGQYIVDQLHGKGTVLMIQGVADALPTKDRREGAMESFKKAPGITVIQGDDCAYQRQKAQEYMENFLTTGKPFDAVYAHNDEMAIGAYMAYEHAAKKPAKKPLFVGIDACQQEVVQMIKDGKLDATFKYPVPSKKAIELAADILAGKKLDGKTFILPTEKVTKENADKYLADNPNLAK